MDIYMPMSTTKRHNEVINTFVGDILPLRRKREAHAFSEQCALVYWGTKDLPVGFTLVNLEEIEDIERFTNIIIMELHYVQPDFMLFKSNPYLENKYRTRTAGQPDLIVEVWSESNSKNDRAFLQNLYATSPITEHWYIEQDSNQIQCYIGKEQLPDQYLTDILVTQKGLEFDLRYLAV
jgi:Uma2 family endonuclease